ncbi:hypothetical protein Sta7437_3828 [Stanieria cyanosphaera PCC 7437]|uniref:Acetyltransferase n=1 Tax=Stanieria cyanosphaera (strain ATCC 29371 / PCC 7437) TaxID=111780 RepID=K9XXJ0_STAC7|nr:hypothetical protein [Stanieria cyanosphaera]AFZ37315.1 hypothetical protein Sta7437_3828 [Stanieria cyanosphaera PCC 7437]
MFLKHKQSGDLVEILEMEEIYDPCKQSITGRFHAGEEMQDPETFAKSNLIFPSGESLPLCWLDPKYQEHLSSQKTASNV